jgi:hypothetical protein
VNRRIKAMTLKTESRVEVSPKVYSIDDAHVFLNWIAEGTDGYLYLVPSAPGGWRQRHRYEGHVEGLKQVSPQKARAITDFVGGACKDWGPVTIAETSAKEFWSPSMESMETIA